MDTLATSIDAIFKQFSPEFIFAFVALSGGLSIPAAKWIHSRMPGDFKVQEHVYAIILNFVVALVLSKIYAQAATTGALVTLSLSAHSLGVTIFAGVKDGKETVAKSVNP